jgi:hypothetical protein
LSSPAQNPLIEASTPIHRVNEAFELAGQQGPLQAPAIPIHEHGDEELSVLSRVNPRRGPTNGGDEINLIVSDLPPTIKLFARFGLNIVPTVSSMTISEPLNRNDHAEELLSGSYCTGSAFLLSPSSSPSWSGQRHVMSSHFH